MGNLGSPIISKAEPSDAVAIRAIAVAANIDAWTEADYLAEIDRPDSYVLKSVELGIVCGFLLARTVPGASDRPNIDLYNIAVRPDRIGRGIGKALISDLLDRLAQTDAETIWLEVRRSNETAIKFYEKQGFVAEISRPRFYSDPIEDAVIMRLDLRGRGGTPGVTWE
jgi:ribosomal-protein-alanine N-acetyltransferase